LESENYTRGVGAIAASNLLTDGQALVTSQGSPNQARYPTNLVKIAQQIVPIGPRHRVSGNRLYGIVLVPAR
jgi:hypothetical protein